jgi:hypothetical protein
VVVVAEDCLLVLAESVGDRVTADTGDVGRGLLPDLATLDVQTTDLDKVAAFGVVGGDELSYNGDRLLGVDRLARAIKGLVAHAEGVEIATVSVAVASVSVAITVAAGGVRGAGAVAGNAGVRGEGVGDGVLFDCQQYSRIHGSGVPLAASHMSISLQQDPVLPSPVLALLSAPPQPSELAFPSMN